MMAMITPMAMLLVGTVCPKIWTELASTLPPKASMAVLMEEAMVLTWVMLPIPKAARKPKTQNTPPSQLQLLPRPFLM